MGEEEEKSSVGKGKSPQDTPSLPPKKEQHRTEPNAGAGDPTDGREPYEWNTRYPPEAVFQIRLESAYIALVFLSAYLLIFASWNGWISSYLALSNNEARTLKKYLYYAGSGMLGGVTFGIKYLYRMVARGYWHRDRRIWRLMTPFVAMTLAFIVGAMIDASLIPTRGPISSAAIISTGFLVGYFADQAVAKMYEIAEVIFGKSAATKAGDGK